MSTDGHLYVYDGDRLMSPKKIAERLNNPIAKLSAKQLCEKMYPVFFSASREREQELMIGAAQIYLDAIRVALAVEGSQAATSSPKPSSADSATQGGAV